MLLFRAWNICISKEVSDKIMENKTPLYDRQHDAITWNVADDLKLLANAYGSIYVCFHIVLIIID